MMYVVAFVDIKSAFSYNTISLGPFHRHIMTYPMPLRFSVSKRFLLSTPPAIGFAL